jgi:YD repeat-containing protein
VYDAFGQKVKESMLLEGTPGTDAVWADTYTYFDSLGRQTINVDAEGYVSAWQYNGFDETTVTTEYARAISTANLLTTTPPSLPAAGDAITGYDRSTVTSFDALGRKSSDTQLRHYQRSDLTEGLRDVVNTYAYNAEGQVVSMVADGVQTQTAYDALGRTISVTEADRDVLVATALTALEQSTPDLYSTSLYERASPYSTIVYDAYGNAVQVTRFANGWRNGSAIADATRDQVITTRYDRQGRAVISTDALQLKTYNRYNEADQLSESWYTLSGSDGRASTVRSFFTYDNVGHQISQRAQRETYRVFYGVTTTGAVQNDAREYISYNGFGEVISKGFDGTTQPVQFIYDNAGHLQQSNVNAAMRATCNKAMSMQA